MVITFAASNFENHHEVDAAIRWWKPKTDRKWVSTRQTTGIKLLYTTIATVTMNLIVSAAIVLLNLYITVCISY